MIGKPIRSHEERTQNARPFGTTCRRIARAAARGVLLICSAAVLPFAQPAHAALVGDYTIRRTVEVLWAGSGAPTCRLHSLGLAQ